MTAAPAMPGEAVPTDRKLHVAIFMQSFSGGGIERLYTRLAAIWMRQGHKVVFLVNQDEGPTRTNLPAGTPIIQFRADKPARSVAEMRAYVRNHRPDILLSGHDHANLMLCATKLLVGRTSTKFVVGQHNSLSGNRLRGWKDRVVPLLYRFLMNRADAIFAVSTGVADELRQLLHVPAERVAVIHNGVVPDDLETRFDDAAADAFLSGLPQRPVVLAMGRFVDQKDFATLIAAFAYARTHLGTDATLAILGDGPDRQAMSALVDRLGIADDVVMPGFKPNPFAYLRRASVFVLSSRYEGFANVVAEALACGTPVISTDCPFGPSEILDGGRYGTLVPVGDTQAMATAIHAAIAGRHDAAALTARGQSFSEAACSTKYLKLFEQARAAN